MNTTNKKHMARENRAKQFAPFAALKGYEEELYVKERELNYEPRKEISEDMASTINDKLAMLQRGERVRVTHYNGYRYIETKGTLNQINIEKKFIKIDSHTIRFIDIYRIR